MNLKFRNLSIVFLLSSSLLFAQAAKQPPLWTSKPDAAAFEKIENEHLAAAQKSLDQMIAAKGPRTIANTLAPYDEAIRQLGSAAYFSGLMEHVNPDKAFRDKAAEMTRKTSAAVLGPFPKQEVYKGVFSVDFLKAQAHTNNNLNTQKIQFPPPGGRK